MGASDFLKSWGETNFLIFRETSRVTWGLLSAMRHGAYFDVGLIVTSAVRHGAYCDVGLIVTSAVRYGGY